MNGKHNWCDFEDFLMNVLGLYSSGDCSHKKCQHENCNKDKDDFSKQKTLNDIINDYKANSCQFKPYFKGKPLKSDIPYGCSYAGFEMSNISNKKGDAIGVKLTYIVPGVEKSDLSVSLDENTCIVKCSKDIMFFGKLNSKVRMKFDIDYDQTVSRMINGVLEIFIYRKIEEKKTFNIDIV